MSLASVATAQLARTSPESLQTLEATQRRQKEKIDEAVQGFEAVFLHQMLQPLEDAGEAFFGGEQGGKIFGGLFRQQIADAMAKAEPLGLRRWLGPTLGEAAGELRAELSDHRAPLVTPDMGSSFVGRESE